MINKRLQIVLIGDSSAKTSNLTYRVTNYVYLASFFIYALKLLQKVIFFDERYRNNIQAFLASV